MNAEAEAVTVDAGRPPRGALCLAKGEPVAFGAGAWRVEDCYSYRKRLYVRAYRVMPGPGSTVHPGLCLEVPLDTVNWWTCPADKPAHGGRPLPPRPANWQALANIPPAEGAA